MSEETELAESQKYLAFVVPLEAAALPVIP